MSYNCHHSIMKIVLNLTFAVLFIAGVFASLPEEITSTKPVLTQKEEIRYKLTRELQKFRQYGIIPFCPHLLTPEEIVFAEEKLEEFVACGNATIDIFLDKFDDNFDFNVIDQNFAQISTPVCEIFDDIFRCVSEISPVIDLCLEEREKNFKNKLFAIVPLIQQTFCLRNGVLIAEIVQHADSKRCLPSTINSLTNVGITELFDSNSTELFGDAKVCQRSSDVLNQIYTTVGECSLGVLEKVKDMLGFFCEGTHCERYLPDLQC